MYVKKEKGWNTQIHIYILDLLTRIFDEFIAVKFRLKNTEKHALVESTRHEYLHALMMGVTVTKRGWKV